MVICSKNARFVILFCPCTPAQVNTPQNTPLPYSQTGRLNCSYYPANSESCTLEKCAILLNRNQCTLGLLFYMIVIY